MVAITVLDRRQQLFARKADAKAPNSSSYVAVTLAFKR